MSEEAFKEFLPVLMKAQTVAILCWPPGTNGTTNEFTRAAGDGLADRIRAEGFQPSALLDGTQGKSAETVSVQDVSVFYTPSDLDKDFQDNCDIRIHLRIDDQSLVGTFTKNEVSIQGSYAATLWIYGNGSDRPFRASWSGSVNKSAAGEAPLEEIPSWSIYGYPEDETERLEQFAKESGAGALNAINQFGKPKSGP